MKLWIRTQNEKRLCLIEDLYIHENIRYKDVEEKEIIKDITGRYIENKTTRQEIDEYISCEIWGNNHLLGVYNTKEKGFEILDEIEKFLKIKEIMLSGIYYHLPNSERMKVFEDFKGTDIEISNQMLVYDMPKEED